MLENKFHLSGVSNRKIPLFFMTILGISIGTLGTGTAHASTPPISSPIHCSGWVGPAGESTAEHFKVVTEINHDEQTAITGNATQMIAGLLFFKKTNEAEISITDLATHLTVGSHASFNGAGVLNVGFSLMGVPGQSDRHVIFECTRN